jgi:predicted neuraminidase
VSQGFVFGDLPTPSCHTSTIVETTPGTLIAAWFGCAAEGNRDVGIWTWRLENGVWTAPVQVATGVQSDGARWPCWNRMLFQMPGGELLLFDKVGPSPVAWWGLVRSSADGGCTWGEMTLTDLPNPNSGTDAVTLVDGRHRLIDNHGEKARSPLNIARSRDGRTWTPAVTLETEPGEFSCPAIIQAAEGKVHVTYTWNRKRSAHAVIDPGRLGSNPTPDAGVQKVSP